jgi:penicillin-binding protein 1A
MGDTPKQPSRGQPAGTNTRNRSPKSRSERPRGRRIAVRTIQIAGISVAGLIVLGIGAGVGYASSMLKGLPTISATTFTNLSQPSVVYDRNGKVIGKFEQNGTRQPITSLKQVSGHLVDAFVAGEDKTFWTNIGINPIAMGRALIQDLTHHQIESGASTITQQTVKLAVFPEQQQTLRRKVQEIALAIRLNHILTKQEIMTDYMNWVWMGRMGGQQVYGVQAAAQILFHKDVKNLNLPEAAFIASIPNNPAMLTPYRYDSKGKRYVIDPSPVLPRQHYILEQMLKNQMISKSEYEQALHFDIKKDLHLPPKVSYEYPYLMQEEIRPRLEQELVKQGLYPNATAVDAALSTAGYKIYTTIDLSMQKHMDKVLANPSFYAGTQTTYLGSDGKLHKNRFEAGATLIDNKTGGILAIGGGDGKTELDHSDVPRQPGSSIKPLVDYGPALDLHKITAATPLKDAPIHYYHSDGSTPYDDDMRWRGITTVREALTYSYNIPAIEVLHQIGPATGTSYLAKMGITPHSTTLSGQPTLVKSAGYDDLDSLSTAIGGLTYGLTVQQMTSAYSTLADQGVWHQSYLIQKIVDRDGSTVYQAHPQVNKVFSPQATYILDSILRDVVLRGTASAVGAHFPNQYVYGKTGTSEDEKDGWFLGFTQDYTLGLWTGYDHPQHIPSTVYNRKFDMWNQIMDPVLKAHPATNPLPRPAGIVSVAVCRRSGELPTALCRADHDVYTELFIDGTQPTQTCDVHVQLPYVVLNGKKYLATTKTPPSEIRVGIFLKPPFTIDKGVTTSISGELAPTQPDPRGGTVLPAFSSSQIAKAPSAPKVSAQLDADGVHLTWSAVSGASGYSVWRATKPDGPYVQVDGNVKGTEYVDANPPASASTVYYRVYSLSAQGMSAASNTVTVQLANSPDGGGGQGTGLTNDTGPNASGSTGDGSGSNNTAAGDVNGGQAGGTPADGTTGTDWLGNSLG